MCKLYTKLGFAKKERRFFMNSKNTKRALVSSALAMLVCVALLIGTTFAWFTDTASTAVNKIRSGTIDVVLEMKNGEGNWVSAEGETLTFKPPTTERPTKSFGSRAAPIT